MMLRLKYSSFLNFAMRKKITRTLQRSATVPATMVAAVAAKAN